MRVIARKEEDFLTTNVDLIMTLFIQPTQLIKYMHYPHLLILYVTWTIIYITRMFYCKQTGGTVSCIVY